ncbi:MAG: hypothetical protein CMI23_01720 [Opitutae bacterium]|nr:hypothetical protein [Opitutae bacterium]|tara:strand:+ start:1031 stop:2248 length:1218 start_codon:yes stop_codon:yes gene_type:complete
MNSFTFVISLLLKIIFIQPVFSESEYNKVENQLVPPSLVWHRAYSGSGEESHPHYVIQTNDLGFLMVGETGFVEERNARIFLVKTDKNGHLLWQKEFGKPGYNLGNCVLELRDGNYLVAGSINFNAALIKVDANSGKIIWTRTWNFGTEDAFESIIQSEDEDILATGYKDGLAEGTFLNWGKGILLKIDPDGQEKWKKDISAYTSSGYRIKKTAKNYLLLCHPRNEESLDHNLLKIEPNGKILWSKSLNTIYWGLDSLSNGISVLAGHTRKSTLSNNWDIELSSVNENGDLIWTRFFGQPRGYDGRWIHDEVWGVYATPDGGWLAVAGTGDETRRYEKKGHPTGPSGEWKIYLIKVDSNGKSEWEGLYGQKGMDWAGEDLCVTADGGILIANDCGAFGFTKIKKF